MTSTSSTDNLQTKKFYQENDASGVKKLRHEPKLQKFKVETKIAVNQRLEPQKQQSARNCHKKTPIGLTKKFEKAWKERKNKSELQLTEEGNISISRFSVQGLSSIEDEMIYEKEIIAYNVLLEDEEIPKNSQEDVPGNSEVQTKKMVAKSKSLKEVHNCKKKGAVISFKASYFGRSSNSFDLGFSLSSSGDLSRYRKSESFTSASNKTVSTVCTCEHGSKSACKRCIANDKMWTKGRLNNNGRDFQGLRNNTETMDMTGLWKESTCLKGKKMTYTRDSQEEEQKIYHPSWKNSSQHFRNKQEIIDEFLNNDIFDEICNNDR